MFKVTPKNFFFDRAHVIRKIGEARVKVLSKAGAHIRRIAQTSMRYRKNKSSPPGTPPFAHKQTGALLRKLLFFSYDERTDSVVVGPIGARRGEAPRLSEFGGTTKRVKRGQVVTVQYPARPFMAPALAKIEPSLPKQWANSVLGP